MTKNDKIYEAFATVMAIILSLVLGMVPWFLFAFAIWWWFIC
jgi:hypothetical protein